MTGLCCLLQMKKELLFFLVLLLHFMALLFKYFSIVLRNIRGGRGRHDNAEEKMKTLFFVFVLLT